MSTSYYYFAASLPMINFDGKLPMTMDEFLVDCQRLLSDEDYRLLKSLWTDDGVSVQWSNKACHQWGCFERGFKNEMAAFRAKKVHQDPTDHIRGELAKEPDLVDTITEAYNTDNLLEGAKILDKKRWAFLDDLQSGHYFDFESIMIYGLKLKILEKYEIYRSPRGAEVFEELKKINFSEVLEN